jgi:hypothetical protein
MLSQIVGPVDINSAAVLVSFFGMLTFVGGIWFAKRRSRLEINNDFDLAQLRLVNDQKLSLKKLEDSRALEERKIDSKHAQIMADPKLISARAREVKDTIHTGSSGADK